MNQTMLSHIFERNVCFVIDTSRSMNNQMKFLKGQLIQVLKERTNLLRDFKFNLIQFSDNVTKFAQHLIFCDKKTVEIATEWIGSITCTPSAQTDIVSALLEAYEHHDIDAICLITSSFLKDRPSIILEKLKPTCKKPVHGIYLKHTSCDPEVCGFLRDLAQLTRGSFYTVSLSPDCENIDSILPIVEVDFTQTSTLCDSSYCGSIFNHRNRNKIINSQILESGVLLAESRALAKCAGINLSTTPLASSIMKGVKVLARLDRDGLFYLGEIKQQDLNDAFLVKFASCPALRKSSLHEITHHNMIAYEDAYRLSISLGDKVLASWQNDGRYGPGTVLDGYETRSKLNLEEENNYLLVTFFNGQTVSIKRRTALRISPTIFDHISLNIQLPESQRRKQRLHVEDSDILKFQDRFGWRRNDVKNEKLKKMIKKKIEENTNLIRALDLNIDQQSNERFSSMIGQRTTRDQLNPRMIGSASSCHLKSPPLIGRASSRDLLRDYDSGFFSDEENKNNGYTHIEKDLFLRENQVGENTNNRQRKIISSCPTRQRNTFKFSINNEGKTSRQYSGSVSSAPRATFRKTTMKVNIDEKKPNRPTHEKYKTAKDIPFFTETANYDKLEKQDALRLVKDKKNVTKYTPNVLARKHVNYSEYQDVSGVQFPQATDRKFTRIINENWSPETVIRKSVGSHNRNEQLGQNDDKCCAYTLKFTRSKDKRCFQDIEDKVALEEAKEKKRIEFRKNRRIEHEHKMEKAKSENEESKTSRLETKQMKHQEILRQEEERREKVETLIHDRCKVMKEKRMKFADIEDSHQIKSEEREARRLANRQMKELGRREEFHNRLREEWRAEDKRAERRRHEATRGKTSRQKEVEEMKEKKTLRSKPSFKNNKQASCHNCMINIRYELRKHTRLWNTEIITHEVSTNYIF
ncbi:trichohyalin-like [Xenia sp. Carnegie-2017]|uniref:trichohyalin-like n=1 Tax=Xenia sp. Carnegie-2017 TaxID=2897299 RepID=UPI001F04B0C2|nr:trichohyalin-like [Xenia sp. Carnegie-2017]